MSQILCLPFFCYYFSCQAQEWAALLKKLERAAHVKWAALCLTAFPSNKTKLLTLSLNFLACKTDKLTGSISGNRYEERMKL